MGIAGPPMKQGYQRNKIPQKGISLLVQVNIWISMKILPSKISSPTRLLKLQKSRNLAHSSQDLRVLLKIFVSSQRIWDQEATSERITFPTTKGREKWTPFRSPWNKGVLEKMKGMSTSLRTFPVEWKHQAFISMIMRSEKRDHTIRAIILLLLTRRKDFRTSLGCIRQT